jgi:hypothetical protein
MSFLQISAFAAEELKYINYIGGFYVKHLHVKRMDMIMYFWMTIRNERGNRGQETAMVCFEIMIKN